MLHGRRAGPRLGAAPRWTQRSSARLIDLTHPLVHGAPGFPTEPPLTVNKTTPLSLGPILNLQPGTERFVCNEAYDAGYWANTMLRRTYHPPYVLPEEVGG